MLPHTETSERQETFAIALVLLFFVFLIFAMPFFTVWPDGTTRYVDTPRVEKQPKEYVAASATNPPVFQYHTRSKPATTASQCDRARLTPIDTVRVFPAHGPGFALPTQR